MFKKFFFGSWRKKVLRSKRRWYASSVYRSFKEKKIFFELFIASWYQRKLRIQKRQKEDALLQGNTEGNKQIMMEVCDLFSFRKYITSSSSSSLRCFCPGNHARDQLWCKYSESWGVPTSNSIELQTDCDRNARELNFLFDFGRSSLLIAGFPFQCLEKHKYMRMRNIAFLRRNVSHQWPTELSIRRYPFEFLGRMLRNGRSDEKNTDNKRLKCEHTTLGLFSR